MSLSFSLSPLSVSRWYMCVCLLVVVFTYDWNMITWLHQSNIHFIALLFNARFASKSQTYLVYAISNSAINLSVYFSLSSNMYFGWTYVFPIHTQIWSIHWTENMKKFSKYTTIIVLFMDQLYYIGWIESSIQSSVKAGVFSFN